MLTTNSRNIEVSDISVSLQDIFAEYNQGNLLQKCRLCFNSTGYIQTKLSKKYKIIINDILQVQLMYSSKASNFLCQSCVRSVESFHRFKSEIREKQSYFTKFQTSNYSEKVDHNIDQNTVLIKTEPEESSLLTFYQPTTDSLIESCLFIKTEPSEELLEEFKPVIQYNSNEDNISGDKTQSVDASKIFPSNEKHQRIIEIYLENPHLSTRKISKLIGIGRTTVGLVIRKYKSMVSNFKEIDENSEITSQMSEKLSKGDQCYSSKRELIHDEKKSKGQVPKKAKVKNFKCDDCDKTFRIESQLKRHSLVHLNKPKSDSSDAMPKHEKIHIMENEMNSASDNKKMVDPSEIFPSNGKYQRIIGTCLENPHLSVRRISNLIGIGRTTVGNVLQKYKSIIQNDGKSDKHSEYLPCEICGKLLKRGYVTDMHIRRVHVNIKSHKCDICCRSFFDKTGLTYHLNSVHVPKELKIRNFKCDHCGKSFTGKQLIKNHIFRNHVGAGSYECDYCGKVFNKQRHLEDHQIMHNERNIQCDYPDCEKMFKQEKSMLLHKKTHYIESRFKCSYDNCDKSYSKSNHLDLHIFTSHKKIRDYCPVGNGCTYSVGRRDYMRTHLRKHSELSAGELNKYFKQLSTMNLYQN